MGFFDIPAPLFSWVDTKVLGALPALARLCLWGIAGGALSMWIYHMLSPQERLARTKEDAGAALKSLAVYDGPFEGLWPLLKHSLGLSMKQIGLALGPALAASLPVLFVLLWVSNTYGSAAPLPGERIKLNLSPAAASVFIAPPPNQGGLEPQRLVVWPAPGKTIRLYDARGTILTTLPLPARVPVVHKRLWWNALVGNPSGYLPEQSDVEQIGFAMTPRVYLNIGPLWVRGWEFIFFAVLILSSLMIKIIFRIH